MSHEPNAAGGVDAARAGLAGRCPRCGEGALFGGLLRLRPSCERCGLDFAVFDTADGPAFFVMSIVGIVLAGLAVWFEFAVSPPVWVHVLLWPLVALLLSLPMLRLAKGLMVGLQFRNRAEEGRLTDGGRD